MTGVVAETVVEEVGRARQRWMERSEEPVSRYVPGGLEKQIAFTAPVMGVDGLALLSHWLRDGVSRVSLGNLGPGRQVVNIYIYVPLWVFIVWRREVGNFRVGGI